jgi:alpha-L-fucosidase 2
MKKKEFKIIRYPFKYSAMPVNKRQMIVPKHGYCSTYPSDSYADAMVTAGTGIKMVIYGEPYRETIIFQHEKLYVKQYRDNLNPPRIAHVLPEVRRLLKEGKSKEAVLLSVKTAREDGYDERLPWSGDKEIPHRNYNSHPAFIMKLDTKETLPVKDYIRTLDFTSSEAVVRWSDTSGDWVRKSFVSIPDKLCVQFLEAPESSEGINTTLEISVGDVAGTHLWDRHPMPEGMMIDRDYSENMLLTGCKYNPDIMSGKGYAGATRILLDGGCAHIENNRLLIHNARKVLLLTKIEVLEQYDETGIQEVAESLRRLDISNPKDYYELLLGNNRQVLGELMERSSISLDCGDDGLLSTEELLALQHSKQDLCPALLEKLYDLGRYFLITESGELPPAIGQYNINVNLQVCSGNLTNLPEAMEVFFRFIEEKLPDFKLNAMNIFGCRGILGDIHPDIDNGLFYHFSSTWPHHYWVSCVGWIYNEFWGHYLVTGDLDFLKNRILPGLREIALFFEDYLTDIDENGDYIFYPCFSPENSPRGRNWSPIAINACMDIMVCREVLDNLITGCDILGIQDPCIDKWQSMLSKLPAYLLDEEGALKEWAWPQIPENYNHRHVSHHYDVWPGNAITWEDTPELAKAVLLSNRKRGQEDDSAHGIIHRIFTAIRLKDREDAFMNLKQILEHGFINRSLMANHFPYLAYFPDFTGSLPAVLVEMIVYSSPGIIELLPALPKMLIKGELRGICSFTFAHLNLITWDLDKGIITIDLHSLSSQATDIRYRYGLKSLEINGIKIPVADNVANINVEKDADYHLILEVEPCKG